MAKLKVFRGTKAQIDKKAVTDGAILVATDTSRCNKSHFCRLGSFKHVHEPCAEQGC